MNTLAQTVTQNFHGRYGESPAFVVRAPGRVNLIGEHTDYNDGFVLPLAIDRAIWIALRSRADREVHIHSLDFDVTAVFHLDTLFKETNRRANHWLEYLKGVAWALQEEGYQLAGWEGVMAGDIPKGAGLSSSAALELATARAFTAVTNQLWDPAAMALLCQKAENQWVGVNCGIMDQMISAAGQEGHALLIDCRTLDTKAVPLPVGTAVVILDTNTRRGLVDSAYNERRDQCDQAAKFFGVPFLRDVSITDFLANEDQLKPLIRRRARHVVTENIRVLNAVTAMLNNDAAMLGTLMNQSHQSLRDDFEVSSYELNVMVELAQAQPGCLGARMTGAGFGGCAVALVREETAMPFAQIVATAYAQATSLTPSVYVCQPSAGASVIGNRTSGYGQLGDFDKMG